MEAAKKTPSPAQKESTFTGNKGLQMEEPLLFELDDPGLSGVDWTKPLEKKRRLGSLERSEKIGLPGLSEPQVVRHFTRLSQKNYSIDAGFYPLGSCTMKHNPRLNEKIARNPGFTALHPLQPFETVQGALGLMDALSHWLMT
ncbi:MAG: aminomethyl-transferring glycine dehydrogenase subunit GcvPB, partial [Alphaproteobacteria bacterium]|nr:aminomethyl-transferring glycine dehydrogenase subunit GcvPB [Alphaproteobacteria bacterium]